MKFVNEILFSLEDPTSVLDVPDDCTDQVQGYADDMSKWLNKLTVHSTPQNHRKHDHSKPCLICKKTGHSFKGCKVLNDHEFLKLAYIKTCLYFSTIQRTQADHHINDLCTELNINIPEEDTYIHIWENSQADFHEAEVNW